MGPRTYLTPSDIAYITIYGLAALVGLCLNSLTIAIIVNGIKFGKGIKIQLTNMAVADILCSIATLSSGIVEGLTVLPIPYIWEVCGLMQLVNIVFFQASLLSNTAISLERFVAVYFPLKMREYRRRHVIIITVGIWILSVLINLSYIEEFHFYADPLTNPDKFCISELYLAPSAITLVGYSICYFLPLTVIVTSYTLICIKLRRRKVVGEQQSSKDQLVNIQVFKKTIKA